jgi:hypothetical protein
MTKLLKVSDLFAENKHHHFLGLNAGPALEIPSLLNMVRNFTIDSSGPIWSAINGHRYTVDADSYQSVRKLKTPVDFSYCLLNDPATTDRINHNIQLTNNLFLEPKTNEKWFV